MQREFSRGILCEDHSIAFLPAFLQSRSWRCSTLSGCEERQLGMRLQAPRLQRRLRRRACGADDSDAASRQPKSGSGRIASVMNVTASDACRQQRSRRGRTTAPWRSAHGRGCRTAWPRSRSGTPPWKLSSRSVQHARARLLFCSDELKGVDSFMVVPALESAAAASAVNQSHVAACMGAMHRVVERCIVDACSKGRLPRRRTCRARSTS